MESAGPLPRREFLKTLTVGGVAARSLLTGRDASADEQQGPAPFPDSDESVADEVFPQGVASGDPRPDGFLLWTRVPSTDSAPVDYQVADSENFERIVSQGTVTASPETDHTTRVRIAGLEPKRRYWYRFRALGVSSPVGRTRTVPLQDDDDPVTIAFASCQDYIGRWYHAWRALAERADELDLVLFLGDYIYEYERYPQLQEPQPGREIKLPDGLIIDAKQGVVAARTLADYRQLYRVIRSDKDLRRIHQLCPFVIIWDDHEHANDAWQDHAVDFNDKRGDEKDPARREAATRAWFEYLPVDVPYEPDKHFPEDIVTWRQLRWGKHVDLFLTDDRYYRDDHLIPEGPIDLAAGKLVPFSLLGSRTMCVKPIVDERDAQAPATMLGEAQRTWLIQSAQESTATWKVWASALMVSPFVLDLRQEEKAPPAFRKLFYFKTDQWDGFPSERKRILGDLAEVTNLVVLSGDLHGFYAANLHREPDDPDSPLVGVEFTVAGISSISLQEQVEAITASQPLLAQSGLAELAAKLDENLRQSSPQFVHADSRAYGVGLAKFAADRLDVEFLLVEGVREPEWNGDTESVSFHVANGESRIRQDD